MWPIETIISFITWRGINNLIVHHRGNQVCVDRTTNTAWINTGEITHHATTIITACSPSHIDFAGCSITIVHCWFVLVTAKEFQSFAPRVEIAHVLCIAMTESCCGKSFAIIVNHHRAIHNFIASIFIHIGNNIIMIAISIPRTIAVVAVPCPARAPCVRDFVQVHRHHLVARVDATS